MIESIMKYLSVAILAVADLTTLNLVLLSFSRPQIRVFVNLREEWGDDGRQHSNGVWHVTIQNFDERTLRGRILVRIKTGTRGGFRGAKVSALVGPDGIFDWKYLDADSKSQLVIEASRLRALKTWTFKIRNVNKLEDVSAEVLFRPEDNTLMRQWNSRFLAPRQYATEGGDAYFCWRADGESEKNAKINDHRRVPGWRSLGLALFASLLTHVTIQAFLNGETELVVEGVWASLVDNYAFTIGLLLAVITCFFIVRRSLFPVAQGYRAEFELTKPGPPKDWIGSRRSSSSGGQGERRSI